MSPPEPTGGPASPPGGTRARVGGRASSRYGWFVGLVALLLFALITVNTIETTPNGSSGIAPGHTIPSFAVPLALSSLQGDANVATRAHQGAAGNVPACSIHSAEVLNVCAMYDRGPLVLVLFVNGGSCPDVLDELERLAPSFPGLQIAAVEIRGSRSALRSLVRRRGLTFPVGYDDDGILVSLYKDTSCPQITFTYPGGTVAEPALLHQPTYATLRARVDELVIASRRRAAMAS